ncbi:MAG: NAD(+) diphosphatase [Clostridiales bacterium]|nr:NAD(+) diphosphatase [Clostridiales bacterium]
MIQDLEGTQFSNVWRDIQPAPEDRIYIPRGGDVLVNEAGELPMRWEIPRMTDAEFRYLFEADDERYFLCLTELAMLGARGYDWQPARQTARNARPMYRALAGFTAMHLADWYGKNRFCGRCGGETVPGHDERKLVCPNCGNVIYPRLNPAVIVAVTDGERLLMTRYQPAHRSVRHFVLIAGFVEIGETAEQCVAREVLEETGLRVKHIRYAGSQPWGCEGNLTLGYYCELDGDDTITLQEDELGEGRWFRREEVPVPDDEVSITAHMIRAFREGREWETPFS